MELGNEFKKQFEQYRTPIKWEPRREQTQEQYGEVLKQEEAERRRKKDTGYTYNDGSPIMEADIVQGRSSTALVVRSIQGKWYLINKQKGVLELSQYDGVLTKAT